MLHKKNILLILPLIFINAAFAQNDFIWEGQADKAGKGAEYLFFAPAEKTLRPVYKPQNKALTPTAKSNRSKKANLKNLAKKTAVKKNFDINMVRISGGCISINSKTPNADPLLSAKCVDDFHISDTEITNFQYNQFLLATGNTAKTGAKQQPVVNVSWQEAVDFTQWLSKKHQKNYTLPNSTQWQYAANTDGNSTRQQICNQENSSSCGNNASKSVQIVKLLAPSEWGLYDMYGNVWEWILDDSKPEKTVKGGSWRSVDNIFDLNHKYTPNIEKSADIGFRIVSD